ncbi:B-cell receptor-associated protein 29-like [Tachypleus tridentatus]|uniref:B-cell receptor-associated protein 29-like n=1 Tax=Tachypleus tridentatus TaxID=6853 RepID=UPI003FD47E4B
MSIQWTLVAGFLYAEIAFLILLLLPIISPTRWSQIFKSRLCQAVKRQAHVYFTVCIVGFVLLFLDSIREMRKHGQGKNTESQHGHLDAELQRNVRVFRAERNFYISGFALFLWLIIRRLLILISNQALLLAQCEASMKQASRASETAEKLMKDLETKNKLETADNDDNDKIQLESKEREVIRLREELSKTKEEVENTKEDMELIKLQAESVNKEYMKLMDEYNILQAEKLKVEHSETKKDS